MKTPEERKTENKNLSEICIERIYTIKEMKGFLQNINLHISKRRDKQKHNHH